MLVYGDPKFSQSLSSVLEAFRARLDGADPASLDDLRALLIFAGQLEQAAVDCEAIVTKHPMLSAAISHTTDAVAAHFCRQWSADLQPALCVNVNQSSRAEADYKSALRPRMHVRSATFPQGASNLESVTDAFMKVNEALSHKSGARDFPITIKVPEGFAFYALFPEQYCATAQAWAAQHSNGGEVVVIGIRSIGTSLSAVVKETLAAAGLKAQRFTVRPTGHPFQRQIELQFPVASSKQVLVVDEGPGISGSSMAAVARACVSAGVRDISFLPGHGGEPGAAATPAIREVWSRTPRFLTPLDELKWNGLSLTQSLAAKAQEFDGGGAFENVKDVSVGRWRKYAFENEKDWPTTAAQFERMKFLCVRPGGNSVLWKFAGLHCDGRGASDAALKKLHARARAGFGPAPLGTFHGFIAMPWMEGTRLTRADATDAKVLKRIGYYIVHAAEPSLSAEEQEAAIDRLAEMLYRNANEALGNAFAEKTRAFADAARRAEFPLSYGDGHLAPHEWIRTKAGLLLKVDGEGHAEDHTMVGRQSSLWDVAGALVEWDLSLRAAAPLLFAIEQAGVRVDSGALVFYVMAYSAFRLGLISLSRGQTSDANERNRLSEARGYYLGKLSQNGKTMFAPRAANHTPEACAPHFRLDRYG